MQTVALAEVTRTSTGLEHLSVITAGSYVAQGPDILAAQGPRQILATLCQQHDCVIMDSTPVLEFAVALDLGPMVDCVLMVARARRSVAPVVRAIKMLEDIGAEVPGIVVNDVLPEDELSAQYGYYGASASLSSPQ